MGTLKSWWLVESEGQVPSAFRNAEDAHMVVRVRDARLVGEVVPAERVAGLVDVLYEIAYQAGLIDCDYDLIERLLEKHGDGRSGWVRKS